MQLCKYFIVSLLIVSPLIAATVSQEAPARRPNIVLLLADDLGWPDIDSFKCGDIATPHLDRLAAQGARFQFTGSTHEQSTWLVGAYVRTGELAWGHLRARIESGTIARETANHAQAVGDSHSHGESTRRVKFRTFENR